MIIVKLGNVVVDYVKVEEMIEDEEGHELVLLVDEAEALRVARPVGGVDAEAGQDGAAGQDPEEHNRNHQRPINEKELTSTFCRWNK